MLSSGSKCCPQLSNGGIRKPPTRCFLQGESGRRGNGHKFQCGKSHLDIRGRKTQPKNKSQ